MSDIASSPASPRRRIGYWVATVFVAGSAALAGAMDVFRVQPLFGVLLHLGYPPYFATVLGIWKILGALALIVPGNPRIKEWAYAGLFIDYTAAMASHAAVQDALVAQVGPIVSLAALAASYALRPIARRITAP